MAVERFDLRPNRQLLDNDFNGYKLSLDPLTTYSIKINDLHEIKLGEEQYSFQHIKSFSLHNHLHQDYWNLDHVYYISEDFSVQHVAIKEFRLTEPQSVFKIPQKITHAVGHWNVTMQFVSPDYVILADGTGFLYLIQAVDRASCSEWKLRFSTDECASKKPFILLHAIMRNASMIECLLMHIDERSVVEGLCDVDENLPFVVVLEWITLSIDVDVNWTLTRCRRIAACGSIEYGALESSGSGIYIISENRFQFIHDSLKSVDLKLLEFETAVKDRNPVYVWTQTTDEVSIWIKFAEKVSKNDLHIKITSSRLHVGLKSGSVLIEGAFFSLIEADSSSWTWQDNIVEITLNKVNQGLVWQELIKGDDQGQEALDASMASQIQEQLAHLSSEHPVSQKKPFDTFNPQQLEECDDNPVNTLNLTRLDGETHQLTHEVTLSGHQWLFSVMKFPNEVPAFCIRHDVDGILWQPFGITLDEGSSTWKCEHVSTFNALGYVTASKQEKKFLSCSPECTFAALCDARLHLYLYFQPANIESELRNRKTGQRVKTAAKQQLVTLDSSEVLGLQVSNDNVFVLTRESLFAVRVFER